MPKFHIEFFDVNLSCVDVQVLSSEVERPPSGSMGSAVNAGHMCRERSRHTSCAKIRSARSSGSLFFFFRKFLNELILVTFVLASGDLWRFFQKSCWSRHQFVESLDTCFGTETSFIYSTWFCFTIVYSWSR